MANKQISKVTLGGVTYDIKDEAARARLTALEGIASGGVSIKVVEELPTPGDDTLGIIFFKKKTPAGKEGDIFDEYLTVKVTEGSQEVAKWEHIGSTAIDLSEYVTKEHHHKVKGEVKFPTYQGSISGTLRLPEINTNVQIPKEQVLKIDNAGTAYTLTGGSVQKEMDIRDTFAREALRAEYLDSTETLVFEEAPSAQAVTATGETQVTFPTLSGALPSFLTTEVAKNIIIDVNQNRDVALDSLEVLSTSTKASQIIDTETSGFALFGGGVSNTSEDHL